MKKTVINEYPADGPIKIGDLEFENIDAIREIVDCSLDSRQEWYMTKGMPIKISKTNVPKEFEGWRATRIYESFPCFDIYDSANENRFFNNFIFHKGEITEERVIHSLLKIPRTSNFCMATLNAPSEFLPIVYYADGYPTVLVCEAQ